MSSGTLVASYSLNHNATKNQYTDAIFMTRKNEKQPSFALLTEQWLKVYHNLKEVHAFRAE